MMATNATICYYGHHIGCLNEDDPGCRGCAERLTAAAHREGHLAARNGIREDRLASDNGEMSRRTSAHTGVTLACAKLYLVSLIRR